MELSGIWKIIQYAGFFHVDEGYELCVERMREK